MTESNARSSNAANGSGPANSLLNGSPISPLSNSLQEMMGTSPPNSSGPLTDDKPVIFPPVELIVPSAFSSSNSEETPIIFPPVELLVPSELSNRKLSSKSSDSLSHSPSLSNPALRMNPITSNTVPSSVSSSASSGSLMVSGNDIPQMPPPPPKNQPVERHSLRHGSFDSSFSDRFLKDVTRANDLARQVVDKRSDHDPSSSPKSNPVSATSPAPTSTSPRSSISKKSPRTSATFQQDDLPDMATLMAEGRRKSLQDQQLKSPNVVRYYDHYAPSPARPRSAQSPSSPSAAGGTGTATGMQSRSQDRGSQSGQEVNRSARTPPTQHPLHLVSLPPSLLIDRKAEHSPMQASPEADVDYKTLTAEDAAQRLYNMTLPGITKEKISLVIGKADDFHREILVQYMNCYEFYGVGLDDAFRKLCSHLYLTGETQQIDRILYQFSKRYWECNIDAHRTYRSIEIVYGILFSLVLLNTDLHIANIGANSSRKMQRKTFVKNTTEMIDTMIAGDQSLANEIASMGAENVKRWRRDLESMLKDMYTSVKDNRILQHAHESPTYTRDRSNSIDIGAGGSIRRDSAANSMMTQSPKKESLSMAMVRRRERSAFGGSLSSGSFGSLSRSREFLTTVEDQEGEAAANAGRPPTSPHSITSFENISQYNSDNYAASSMSATSPPAAIPPGSPTASAAMSGSPKTSGVQGQGHRGSHSGSDRSSSGYYSMSGLKEGVTLEGLLIRKHLTDKDESRARNRRWMKVWCIMAIDEERGVELTMFKVDTAHGDGEINFDENDAIDNGSTGGIGGGGRSARQSMDSLTRKTIRILNQQPLVFNLLHSMAESLKAPGYSPTRPYAFSLHLNNGSTHLFQTPTFETLQEWTRTINYWAARRSKEPLRGAVSSADYGWGAAAWERRAREMQSSEQSSADSGSPASAVSEGRKSFTLSSGGFFGIGSSSGGTGSGSPFGNGMKSKKVKLEEWSAPGGTGMVVSTLSEELQLASMRRQADMLSKELEEHSSYKRPMEVQYAGNPAILSKAMTNWHKRNKYLAKEYDRYSLYAQVLRAAVNYRAQEELNKQAQGNAPIDYGASEAHNARGDTPSISESSVVGRSGEEIGDKGSFSTRESESSGDEDGI
ncbi:hypothetical protein HDU76_008233 [Blyttiomyces sp. JEL0837]|nr:hypothetical protein HDU76_008233 [Blyttiomyces sp. JEL0837]